MIDIDIQISISDRSSGWAFNYICRCQNIFQHFPVSLIMCINVPLTFNQNIHYPSALSIYMWSQLSIGHWGKRDISYQFFCSMMEKIYHHKKWYIPRFASLLGLLLFRLDLHLKVWTEWKVLNLSFFIFLRSCWILKHLSSASLAASVSWCRIGPWSE